MSTSRAAPMRNLAIAMTILPTLSIMIRFWARSVNPAQKRYWWDDYLALCAWACCMCCCAFTFVVIPLGIGSHIETIEPASNISHILKILYVSQIMFDVGIAFGKFSVLAFYLRVFTVQIKRFKIALWSTVALVAVFILYKLPTQILLCVPPQKYWDRTLPGKCDNDYTNFGLLLAGLLLDVITDLIILILPMPIITGLHTTKRRKGLLFVAFFCGYATWVTSIGRMGAFIAVRKDLANPDFTWYQVPELSWSLAEISICVLSICIPSWFYLIKKGSETGLRSLFTTSTNDRRSRNKGVKMFPTNDIPSSGFTRLNRDTSTSTAQYGQPDYPGSDKVFSIAQASGGSSASFTDHGDIELGGVSIRQDVYVNEHRKGQDAS